MPFDQDSHLFAKITALEIKRGIFIAGHRFEPFRDPQIAPWNLDLTSPGGKAFETRKLPFALNDTGQFTIFFGEEDAISLLLEQDEENEKILSTGRTDDAIVRIRAFDMKTFYAEAELAAGDYLDLQVADPHCARFLVRPVKASAIAATSREAWFEAMDEGVRVAMSQLGRPVDPLSFIAAAFEGAPAPLREAPAASFSEYYNESKKLQIKRFMGRTFMWARDADIPGLLLSAEHPERAEDGEDGLSRSLADLGFALDAEELSAFVSDALWRGEGVEEALARCFEGAKELGIPKRKLDALLDEAREFAQRVAMSYDRSAEDPQSAQMRSALLDIYASFLAWMRRLGGLVTSPSDLDTEEFSILSESMGNVCDLIKAFGDGQAKMTETRAFTKQLPALDAMVHDLMDSIEAGLGGKPRSGPAPKKAQKEKKAADPARKAKPKKKARPEPEKLYAFEVRIAEIEPAIRRRIVVPGNRSLAELHGILQDAFGWSDSHLHLFRFRDEVFGDPSPDDYEPLTDERKVRLDELSLRTRSKLEYVYDYGDDWEHELVVVATRKAVPGAIETPFCLEARRAVPPEDCGGIPGYMSICELLNKPVDERDEEEKELLVWLGDDWDPERCDLEAINKALAKD